MASIEDGKPKDKIGHYLDKLAEQSRGTVDYVLGEYEGNEIRREDFIEIVVRE